MPELVPPMPYAGGKQAIASRIVHLLPPHIHYLEPYAGALSVLLAKPLSKIETVNDLNGDLITFWRVLRDRPDDLARVCALTPHSRAELRASRHRGDDLDEVEVARRVWVQATQARSASLRTTQRQGWKFVQGGSRMALAAYLDGYVARMAPIAQRLKRVSLECGDAARLDPDLWPAPRRLPLCRSTVCGARIVVGDGLLDECRQVGDRREKIVSHDGSAPSRARWQPGRPAIRCREPVTWFSPSIQPRHDLCESSTCGCECHEVTDADRQIWTQIADEIDDYLNCQAVTSGLDGGLF